MQQDPWSQSPRAPCCGAFGLSPVVSEISDLGENPGSAIAQLLFNQTLPFYNTTYFMGLGKNIHKILIEYYVSDAQQCSVSGSYLLLLLRC